jgi:hypothetical protein
MIPKGISHTSAENPTFQKRNISSIQEIISSIQNYQGLSFLPVTFTGLADMFPQLGSLHGQLCGIFMYQGTAWLFPESALLSNATYIVTKRLAIFPSLAGMSLTNSPLPGNN